MISVPALVASALFSPWIMSGAFQGEVPIFSLLLLLGVGFILNYANYCGAVMTGLAMFGTVALQSVITSAASRIPSLSLVYLGLGVVSVAAGFFLGALIGLGFSMLMARGELRGMLKNWRE